jgi:hypothetical protein
MPDLHSSEVPVSKHLLMANSYIFKALALKISSPFLYVLKINLLAMEHVLTVIFSRLLKI